VRAVYDTNSVRRRLTSSKEVPLEIRRKLYLELSAKIARQLDAKGITEEKLQRDFKEWKKRRP
jgi:hypothetical protein